MFDEHSFMEEITTKEEAEAAYNYFTSNLTSFRHQLASEGLSYEEVQNKVRQCWQNLLKSSQRVGYANSHMVRMAKTYGNGEKKKK